MSTDMDPVPGLPLLTTLFCNSTTVKKKVKISCDFPDELYTKKAFYGGPIGAGLSAIEVSIIAVFFLLSLKMKRDITKVFLTIVYIPLGLSSLFKIALAIYSIMLGAYGWWYMVFLMFFNWFYTTAVLTTSIGSVIFLSALIVIARKRQNFNPCDSWTSYFAVLFFAAILSGSYHFIASQWNPLPASALFFTYLLCTVGIIAELLVCLCVGLMCKPKPAAGTNMAVLTGDPVVDDARSRLGFGAAAVIVMNIPQWFEFYVKIAELFAPYLWNSDDEKTVYYTALAIQLLTFDTVRLFMSLFMLVAFFLTVSSRFAIDQWIRRQHHPTGNPTATQNKVFIATQNQPLLMDTGEKKSPPPPTPPNPPVNHAIAPVAQHPQPMPIPHQVPSPAHGAAHGHPQAPPMYPGIGFAPGMLQLPQNMQTTIVYTPSMAYDNGHPPC